MSTTTALVPVCDTQVLGVLRQLRDATPARVLSPEKRAAKRIWATINNLSIEGALSLLRALGFSKDGFYFDGDYWLIEDLANDQYFPECQGRLANETVKIIFWGGPPDKLKFYRGTLDTFLRDRVLAEIAARGIFTVATWIGTDLEGGA